MPEALQTSWAAALFWGGLSAVSLPLGAYLGIQWRPHGKVLSALLAFGAGALLFALAVELMGHIPELAGEIGNIALVAGVGGALAGGLLFDFCNQFLNNRGAFLRNLSNAKEFVARSKRRRARRLLTRLARLQAFAEVPPEELAELASHVHRRRLADGEGVFAPGDTADELYFVRQGEVEVSDPESSEPPFKVTSFDSFGELGALTRMPRTTAARAVGPTVLYVLERDDLRACATSSETLRAALRELAQQRAADWPYRDQRQDYSQILDLAADDLGEMNMPVEQADIREEREDMRRVAGVGMAIWLGIAIDAIPESLVIGSLIVVDGSMSTAFFVGVFLANFPEAMSGAVSMRLAGMTRSRVMLMWASLCALTAAGAAIGSLLFASATEAASVPLIFVEGLAAGAMLTAIAETMLPEAYEQGGSIIGFATLAGFLAALVSASL